MMLVFLWCCARCCARVQYTCLSCAPIFQLSRPMRRCSVAGAFVRESRQYLGNGLFVGLGSTLFLFVD
jgi:hypothetical protein